MRKQILTLVLAILALRASAQTLSFISASPNKEQGVNVRFQTVNPNPWVDSLHVELEYSLNPNFTGVFPLKSYSYTDSFMDITDSLDDTRYNFPAPGTPIYLRIRMLPDTSSWTPQQSLTKLVTLKVKPTAPTIKVVIKPYATAKGAVTVLNVSSNVDFSLRKYVHFKDSAKTFSSGVIQTQKFAAGTHTVSDTTFNLTQSSWLGYDDVNEAGTAATVAMKVDQYVAPAKPWCTFDSLVGYANSLHAVFRVVGNTLSGNTTMFYKHQNDAQFSSAGPYAFTGTGVEPFSVNIPVTKTGVWKLLAVSTNSMGSYTTDTFTIDNTPPATTVSITPLAASYEGPGKVRITFRVTLTPGEYIDVYSMLSIDTSFNVSESSDKALRVTISGDYSILMDRVTQTGNLYENLSFVTKSGKYVARVRPYLQVKVDFGAGVSSVFPTSTTLFAGFTIRTSKPDTLMLFDESGRLVFSKVVTDGENLRPELKQVGTYIYKLGNQQTGKIIFN